MIDWHLDEAALIELADRWIPNLASVEPLYGDSDQNVLVTDTDGRRHVLKITALPPDLAITSLELQLNLLDHLGGGPGRVACPQASANRMGRRIGEVEDRSGHLHAVWMVGYIDGQLLNDVEHYDPGLLADIGRAVGLVDSRLMSFAHPSAERIVRWDLARLAELSIYCSEVGDPYQRVMLERHFARYHANVLPALADRPRNVIHNDGGNQHNMIVKSVAAGWQICGLIDFGDAVLTQRICGLGIAAAYALFGCDDLAAPIARVCQGYHRVLPLDDADMRLVPGLVASRLAMSVCISSHRAKQEPENDYLQVSSAPAWNLLERLDQEDAGRFAETVREMIHDSN